jgi:hypothetical protein
LIGFNRSTWLIGGIAFAAIWFTGAMVLYTTVSHDSLWEWDISLGLLVLIAALPMCSKRVANTENGSRNDVSVRAACLGHPLL